MKHIFAVKWFKYFKSYYIWTSYFMTDLLSGFFISRSQSDSYKSISVSDLLCFARLIFAAIRLHRDKSYILVALIFILTMIYICDAPQNVFDLLGETFITRMTAELPNWRRGEKTNDVTRVCVYTGNMWHSI